MIELGTIEDMSRAELEQLYCLLLSTIVLLARVLGKPCPIVTRHERRNERLSLR